MPGLGRRVTINERTQRRSPGTGIAAPSHRLDGPDRPGSRELPLRFPITRQGYDRAIVDQRLAELEQEVTELDRELANMQASTPLRSEAAAEIDRIGQQVSAILIEAHESADETRRLAAAEADRRIAEAESRARSITEDADREKTRLQDEIASLHRERDQLLDHVRSIAERLRALADKPVQGLPAEPGHESSAGSAPESS